MSKPSTILIYGRDPCLLDTRGWLLERAGFRVVQTRYAVEVKEFVSSQAIDLLLLCHTLSEAEVESILEGFSGPPSLKTLLMTAGGEHLQLREDLPTLSAFDGPRALLSVTKELVGTQTSSAS